MITLLTTRGQIRGVANHWRMQYFDVRKQEWRHGDDKRQTYEKLAALDAETATPEDVAKIIGNAGWTRITCDACKKEVDCAVWIGEEPDYESSTAMVCKACLVNAVGLVNELCV